MDVDKIIKSITKNFLKDVTHKKFDTKKLNLIAQENFKEYRHASAEAGISIL